MRRVTSQEQSLSATGYGLMALVALLVGIGLLVYYVREVPHLEPSVRNQVYYVVLFPCAVACAVALFGSMRSYARLTAKQPGVALELGGPVVLFVLILWGGVKLVPPSADSFDLTIRAHSADGADPLIRSGTVTLQLDRNVTESFRSSGEAEFKVPEKFLGSTIKILVQIEGYEARWEEHKIAGNALDLALQRSGPVTFQGYVHDEEGKPLSDVTVTSPDCDQNVSTNDSGVFQVRGSPGTLCHLVFSKSHFASYNTDITIDGSRDQKFELRSIKRTGREN